MEAIPPAVEADPDEDLRLSARLAQRLPPQVGGIALNLAGLATWSHALAELHDGLSSAVPSATRIAMAAAAIIMAVELLKLLVAPSLIREELCDHKACGSHGALLMAVTLGAAHLPAGEVAAVAVHTCFALQALMLLWYLYLVRRQLASVSPIWYPPTIGIGASAIAMRAISSLSWRALQLASFGVALFLCVVMWPCVTARLYRSRRTAEAPSVMIHAAPFPLVGLSFMSAFHDEIAWRKQGWLVFAHVLFASSTAAALTTLCAMWARRSALASFVRSRREGYVHPEWAALTFPLVATSQHALLYASRVVAPYHSQGASDAASAWATLTAVVCAAVVLPIDLLFLLWGVPLWLRDGLPLADRAASVLVAADPSDVQDVSAPRTLSSSCLRAMPASREAQEALHTRSTAADANG